MRRGHDDWFDLLGALLRLPGKVVALARARVRRNRPEEVLNRLQIERNAIGCLSWRDFEKLVGSGFQQRGFQVFDHPGNGAHGAVEKILTRRGERFLVHCRHWRAKQVNVRGIRELYAMLATQRMAGGFVVTAGTFTKGARRFAQGRNIELIDGSYLDTLLKDGRRRVAEVIFDGVAANGPETAPYCPACRTAMVVRSARRGASAGSFFWGCSQFPTCRQTMVMWSEGRRSA